MIFLKKLISLPNEINSYKKPLVKTKTNRLEIFNKQFSEEIISNERLVSVIFKNSSLINLNFINVNFDSSVFQKCSFKNCIFDSTSFRQARFNHCSLINCQIKNCNLAEVDFTEITFDKCCFEESERGSLIKAWFESCHFLETNFNGCKGTPLIQTAIVDSKFSKFNKWIEFKGEFFLIDLFYGSRRIDAMFSE